MFTALLPGTLCDEALWAGVTAKQALHTMSAVRGNSLKEAAELVLAQVPKGSFHLVGFSLGAIVAFEVLRLVPERVARLSLLSANPHAATSVQLATWAEQERQVRQGQFETVVADLYRSAGTHQKTLLEMARRVGPDIFLQQLQLLRSRPESLPLLAAYTGPCQLLVGEQDSVTPPPLTWEMAAHLPQARVQVLEKAGHFLPLDAPEALARLFREG